MGEQIVLEGVAVDELRGGDRIRLGDEAVVEVTIPRTGCKRFERIQGFAPAHAAGRLGVMAVVVRGGRIAVGSPAASERAAARTERAAV
jgi:MOSC domain-containing protein YiiM